MSNGKAMWGEVFLQARERVAKSVPRCRQVRLHALHPFVLFCLSTPSSAEATNLCSQDDNTYSIIHVFLTLQPDNAMHYTIIGRLHAYIAYAGQHDTVIFIAKILTTLPRSFGPNFLGSCLQLGGMLAT